MAYLALPGWAQQNRARGPRALALLEWVAREGKATPRLRPIAILADGKYHDAGFYKGTPEPMAVEPGTVYEAEQAGQPAGLFTVEEPRRVLGTWFGFGKWQPPAKAPAAPSPTAEVQTDERRDGGDDDGPPILRRPKQGETSTQVRDRPATQNTPPAAVEEDPDRPVLRRKSSPTESPAAPAATTPAARPPATGTAAQVNVELPKPLVAVSDAEAPEPRPYLFQWRPEEQQRLTRQAVELALKELPRQPMVPGGLRKSAPALQLGSRLEELRVVAYDLDYDNMPEVVLTAAHRAQVAGKPVKYEIALVARLESDEQLRKVFAQVADSRVPEAAAFEFVDAVDADGNGRGDLLFRRKEGARVSFVLYRVGRDQLWELFSGASYKP